MRRSLSLLRTLGRVAYRGQYVRPSTDATDQARNICSARVRVMSYWWLSARSGRANQTLQLTETYSAHLVLAQAIKHGLHHIPVSLEVKTA